MGSNVQFCGLGLGCSEGRRGGGVVEVGEVGGH